METGKKADQLTVRGFRAAGVRAGIKKKDGLLDLALVVSDVPAAAAAVFTTNLVQAAPVKVCRGVIDKGGPVRAVIANSGSANCCTGAEGLADARRTVKETAAVLKCPAREVLVASTGSIGSRLPMEKIAGALPLLAERLRPEGFAEAAEAIMTTDTFPKTSLAEFKAERRSYRVLGIAKGAGMIQPNMATTLGFVFTDAPLESGVLRRLLPPAVKETFNSVTVDGDTSTNDTLAVLANGAAGGAPFGLKSRGASRFAERLGEVLLDLAKMLVRDGEGATKLVEVIVEGARNEEEARRAAFTVANSPLVKTALTGEDPNWGRIMGALGRAGIRFRPEKVEIRFGDVPVVRGGEGLGQAAEDDAKKVMQTAEFPLTIRLGVGQRRGIVYTCDLTREYISINAGYRT